MKEHHRVNVIRINEIQIHGNADKLEIIPIEGYQAIVFKGQFKVGDLAYYVPPDSIVPDRPEYAFLWGGATYEGGTPEKKRRITAKKLRGEWSEGVLMPLVQMPSGVWSLPRQSMEQEKILHAIEGDDVAEYLSIRHYDPPEPGEGTIPGGNEGNPKSRRYPRTFRGWASLIKSWLQGERREGGISLPTYDVEAYKKFMNTFELGEMVYVTEKIHGSNARFTFRKGYFGAGRFYVGSRNLWKAPTSRCAWRRATQENPWIEVWCRQHPGYALYGEITQTQKGYHYGSGDKICFFVFDVRKPDGTWAEMCEHHELESFRVPFVYSGPFDADAIKQYVDGKSLVKGADHIREGIVIKSVPERTVRNLGRAQLKIVSNDFLSKETADEKTKKAA